MENIEEKNVSSQEKKEAIEILLEEVPVNRKLWLKFRVNEAEKKSIKMKADNSKLNMSDYVRRAALRREIPRPLSDEEVKCYTALKELQINFQRIANLINLRIEDDVKIEVHEAVELLKKHLNRIIYDKQS